MVNLEVKDIFNEILSKNALSEQKDMLERGFSVDLELDNNEIKELSINKGNACLACHSKIFNKLSIGQKLAFVVWLDDFVAKNQNRAVAKFNYIVDNEKPFMSYFLKDGELNFDVNIIKLDDDLICSMDILLELCDMGKKCQLEKTIEQFYKTGELDNSFSKLQMVNFLAQIKEPESYKDYIDNKELSEKELKENVLFLNQPLEQITEKNIDFLEEVWMLCTEELKVDDEESEYYLYILNNNFSKAKELFGHFYQTDVDNYYDNYYKEQLNSLSKTISNFEEESNTK
ncbi:MAG: hypothetical protein PHC46_04640 [Clostridia bacterium]|nr:hypothetical protein [Clostridia bacterium]